jgi:hypothetical protein
MLANQIKLEIAKEVLTKSGWGKDIECVHSLSEAIKNDRFIFDIDNNEIISFVAWEDLQEINGQKRVFIKSLWIDPRYRNRNYVIKIRTILRNRFKDTKGVWLNIKKDKLIERI